MALQPADIMVANILARPLVELAPRIAALTRCGGGQIVLAGLLEEQVGLGGGGAKESLVLDAWRWFSVSLTPLSHAYLEHRRRR